MELKKMHVKKKDKVVVIYGKDKATVAEVLATYPKTGKVLVKGVNMVAKHQKANKQNAKGGIFHKEAPIHSSSVMLYCDHCKKGVRVKHQILADGSKVRVCAKCGEQF